MFVRIRRVAVTAASALALGAVAVPAAQANILSLLPGSCGSQTESQPFAAFGDSNSYTLIPGGDFQAGSFPWLMTGGASSGNGSLSLPAGSSAISPANCTSIYHPTARLFVRNTGSPSSHLIVQALYPGLLGGVQTATIGDITGSSTWSPSPAMSIQGQNLLATLSLSKTVIAFRFVPADGSGSWSIDGVYLDPYGRR
ncbi:MAG TPA: hypothetical protein VGF70_10805 [Solirubrobacteraceae bacterium]|jgi:hypothetical protein